MSSSTLDGLAVYLDLLWHWNARMNLTSIADPDEAVDRLVVEPLIAARFVPLEASCLMDVGSGGGSPAVPMKLALPKVRLVMVESKTRKAAFLREAVRRLSLEGAMVEARRVEELLPDRAYDEALDVVTLRAIRADTRLFETLQLFLKPGGQLFLFAAAGGEAGRGRPGVAPPLVFDGDDALVEPLRSRLLRFRKAPLQADRFDIATG